MLNHKKLILAILFIVLNISVVFADNDTCEISVKAGSILTIPVAIDKSETIDGITIKAEFDPALIQGVDGTLNGGILEDKGYDLLVNKEIPGKINLVIYAKDDLVTGEGIVAFITFRVKEDTSSLITLTSISPLSGGFYINDTFCQNLEVTLKPFGDIDLNGKVELSDAISVLKVLAGIPSENIHIDADVNGDKRIGFEELLYILQTISSH